MNLIAAVDENWGIGRNGNNMEIIPKQMRILHKITMGKVVVMGRKTLESLPGGIPLAGRTNLVLTTNPYAVIRGAGVAHSMEEALKQLKHFRDEDIFIIGGESIYRQFLPYCKIAHITKIHQTFEADAWFPNLDKCRDWHVTADSEEQTYFDLEYHFLQYER